MKWAGLEGFLGPICEVYGHDWSPWDYLRLAHRHQVLATRDCRECPVQEVRELTEEQTRMLARGRFSLGAHRGIPGELCG